MLEKYDLTKTVVMDNIIFMSQYYTRPELGLTLKQKKLLLYLISRIEPHDTAFRLETIRIADYCELFEIPLAGGRTRQLLRESMLTLARKVFMLPTAPQCEELFRWVDDMRINYRKGTIQIKLAEKLRPYYLEVKEKCFTIYQLGYVMNFRSKYSFTFYELMKSKQKMKKFYMNTDEVRTCIAYGQYQNYSDLNRYVLEPAIHDINTYADIKITMHEVRSGRKVTQLLFYIHSKSSKELSLADTWKAPSKNCAKALMEFADKTSDTEEMSVSVRNAGTIRQSNWNK